MFSTNRTTVTVIALVMGLLCIKNASAWIMPIIGSSSVGKTSIIREYIKQSQEKETQKPVVISIDEIKENLVITALNQGAQKNGINNEITSRNQGLKLLGKDVFMEYLEKAGTFIDQNWNKINTLMQMYILQYVKQEKNIIIDLTLDMDLWGKKYISNSAQSWRNFLGMLSQTTSVFSVLIYCPLLKVLENAAERNIMATTQNDDSDFRPIAYVFDLFFSTYNYKPMSEIEKDVTILEKITESDIEVIVNKYPKDFNIRSWLPVTTFTKNTADWVLINDKTQKVSEMANKLSIELKKFLQEKGTTILTKGSETFNPCKEFYGSPDAVLTTLKKNLLEFDFIKQKTRTWINGH